MNKQRTALQLAESERRTEFERRVRKEEEKKRVSVLNLRRASEREVG